MKFYKLIFSLLTILHLVCQAVRIHLKILRKFLLKPVPTALQWLRHCPPGLPPPLGSAIYYYQTQCQTLIAYIRFKSLLLSKFPTSTPPTDTHR